jgi:hypothetical protein
LLHPIDLGDRAASIADADRLGGIHLLCFGVWENAILALSVLEGEVFPVLAFRWLDALAEVDRASGRCSDRAEVNASDARAWRNWQTQGI